MKYEGTRWTQGRHGQVCPCCGQARPKQRRWWRTIQRSLDQQWRVIVLVQSYRVQHLEKVPAINRMVWKDIQKIARAKASYGRTTHDEEVTTAVSAMHRRMTEAHKGVPFLA